MSNPELTTRLESTTETEAELIVQSLQRTTMEYRTAFALDAEESGHLQRVILETPEPTIAFRMDSKNEYLVEGERTRRSLYFYVPEDSNPDAWIDRYWIKSVEKDGVEAMFAVSSEHGVRVHERSSEVEAEPEDIDVALLEFTSEKVIEGIISRKQRTITGLRALADAVRKEFTHVKFNS